MWGGGGVADLQPLHVARRAERAGLQARLRSLFATPGRGKRLEPRTRYGEPFLPGLAALGRQHLGEARVVLERAEALRGRRFQFFGRTIGFPGRIDWEPRGQPKPWLIALNSLDDLFATGVAATLAPTPEVRAGWYEVATGLAREWIAGAPSHSGVAWEVPALARRIPHLIYLQVFFARELPLFHDAALGVARPARELLATAAALFHEPALASAGELPGVWPLLVLGEAGRRAYANLPRRCEGAEPRALRRTGFYVLPGDAGDVMLLDGGTPPPGGDPNLFGYELSVGGMRLVVDAGVGGEEPGPWGDYFRSRRAHNTVAVDAVDDRRSPEVSDVRWIMRDGLLYFAGTHDGFAHRTPALKHRRRVFCLPGRFWVIADELLGAGGVEAESFIHLHPDVRLAAVCRGRPVFTAARSPTAQVQIVPAGTHEVHAVHGIDDARPQGWYAARHGERRSAPVLSLLAIGRLPLVFGYALVPRADAPAELVFHQDAFQLRATLRVADREYTMAVVQEEVELVSSG